MHSATAVTAPPIPSNGSSNSSCAPPAHTNSPKPETRSHPVIQVASPGHLYERKKEEREDEEGDDRKEMRYLSANCVLFTSYAGDSSSVVEEHFNRALGQTNYDVKGATSKAPSPMTQRNFPPSFWNGNYQLSTGSRSTSSYGLSAHPSHDFYNSMAEAYHSSLHPQLGQDPWSHYQLSSQAYFASAYGGVANNRFAPQYGSLLLHQPGPSTSRLGPVPSASHCPSVKAEPWNGRYGDSNPSLDITGDHPPSGYHGPAHTYSGVTALEGGSGSLQDYPKDLYWF
ncbi:protein vestigial-like isoform X2 [Artemia franciscana]